MLRAIVFGALYWGPPIFGKLPGFPRIVLESVSSGEIPEFAIPESTSLNS